MLKFPAVFLLFLLAPILGADEKARIGWNYHWDKALPAETLAGAPGFRQNHWNNRKGTGQGLGIVPFALEYDRGHPTTAILRKWTLGRNNGWLQKQTATPDQVLMNFFTNQEPSLTFSHIPFSSYSVVVCYGNNKGPSTSTISVERKSQNITTGNTPQSSLASKGFLRWNPNNTRPATSP